MATAGEGTGFAGLNSLVTDVEAETSKPRSQQAEDQGREPRAATTGNTKGANTAAQTQREPVARPRDSGKSSWAWWLVIVVPFIILVFVSRPDDKPLEQGQGQIRSVPREKAETRIATSGESRPEYARPRKPGQQNLTVAEATWCVGIREGLEWARARLPGKGQGAYDRFNADIQGYNRWCVQTSATTTTWETAERRVQSKIGEWRQSYNARLRER